MPAIGSESEIEYFEHEILTQSRFEKMKAEVLHRPGEIDSVVVPVRNSTGPHFRLLSVEAPARRVGTNEQSDPTHAKVISYLVKLLTERKKFQISTYVFGGEQREEQTIFSGKSVVKNEANARENNFKWWTEARIQLDATRYIQPDICGRRNSSFLPLKGEKAVIIEVVQSHYPDEEAFHALTSLSNQNYIVLFYFAAKDGWGSGYSRFDTTVENLLGLRCAYWLSNGEFFKNGECVKRGSESETAWYRHIATKYFDSAKKKKDEK